MTSTSEFEGTLAGFDALRELMGEQGLRELIDMFVEDGGVHLDALGSALARRDAALLAERAHALRGSSATLGAFQMAALCSRLESLGRAGTTLGADRDLAQLVVEFERVADFLGEARQH